MSYLEVACEVVKKRRCNKPIHLVYYGRGVCEECWEEHCSGKVDLKILFGIHKSRNEIITDMVNDL